MVSVICKCKFAKFVVPKRKQISPQRKCSSSSSSSVSLARSLRDIRRGPKLKKIGSGCGFCAWRGRSLRLFWRQQWPLSLGEAAERSCPHLRCNFQAALLKAAFTFVSSLCFTDGNDDPDLCKYALLPLSPPLWCNFKNKAGTEPSTQ